jgi:gluconokinase
MEGLSGDIQGMLIMGVAGSGKTTLGKALSEQLGWTFLDADDYHPAVNIEKMKNGIPLTDEDRFPWLRDLNQKLIWLLAKDEHPILACSALKAVYRQILLSKTTGIQVVYLKGDFSLIESRMLVRGSHYMQAGMLKSQFEILEEPVEVFVADISQPLETLVSQIITWVRRV